MTGLQANILAWIDWFDDRMGFPPTRREIGDRFGISTSVVNFNLTAMQREGWVKVSPFKARGIRIVRRPVEASSPVEAV